MARLTDYNENMLSKAQEYLAQAHDYVDETGKTRVNLPKIEGLAVFLGVARQTLYNWGKENPEFLDILERISALQAERVINKALEGVYNPTIAKLLLTKHGYSDKQETDLTSKGDKLTVQIVNYADGQDTPQP